MSHPVEVTPEVLASLPLPDHDDGASKHDRGCILVVGGSAETPGAVLLAGLASLRAGAGRLRVVTHAEVVPALGVALPEARVGSLELDTVVGMLDRSDAVLLGPGMLDIDAARPFLDAITSSMPKGMLVLDAGVLPAAGEHPDWVRRMDGRVLLVPNPTEVEVLGVDDVRAAAEHFGATVAARGAETFVATPDGDWYVDRHGTVGLATSGSGDVAAGLAAGFLARGANPLVAAIWTAAVHGLAGERLGPPGFLARELLDEVPGVLVRLSSSPSTDA